MRQPGVWFRLGLFNLLIAAAIGIMMRYAFVGNLEFLHYLHYSHWLHAHSHLAMLGWVYPALYSLSLYLFVPWQTKARFYRGLFLATLFAVWGMSIAFVPQGYGVASIAFLVLHVILSYVFIYRVWKDLSQVKQKTLSLRFFHTALLFQFISTLALWALPVLINAGLRGTEYYYMAIQWFLHFQLNGWFMFGVLALFFKCLEESKVHLPRREAFWFYRLLVISCFLTYALAVAWSNPLDLIFFVNGMGVSLQFIALILLSVMLSRIRRELYDSFQKRERLFIYAALVCFMLKVLSQSAVIIPDIAQVGYTIRGFVIGFLHLILLGVITMFLFGFALRVGFLSGQARPGAILVLIGFLLVELLLFIQGILLWAAAGFMPYYHESLIAASVIIFVGVLWMLICSVHFGGRDVAGERRTSNGE